MKKERGGVLPSVPIDLLLVHERGSVASINQQTVKNMHKQDVKVIWVVEENGFPPVHSQLPC